MGWTGQEARTGKQGIRINLSENLNRREYRITCAYTGGQYKNGS